MSQLWTFTYGACVREHGSSVFACVLGILVYSNKIVLVYANTCTNLVPEGHTGSDRVVKVVA